MFKKSKPSHPNLLKAKEYVQEVIEKIPPVKKRRERRRLKKIIKWASVFIIIFFIVFVLFLGVYFYKFKKVYDYSLTGKLNLEQAVQEIKNQNFLKAYEHSKSSEKYFVLASESLDTAKDGFMISNTGFFKYQLEDLKKIIKTAEILSKAVQEGTIIGQEFVNIIEQDNDLSFNEFSKEEKRKILQLLFESAPELNGIKANLDLAYLNLKQVKAKGILLPFQGRVNELRENLQESSGLLARLIPLTQMLPELAGYPDASHFLVMLQNSDELRPTGGFLGTYGILEVEYGDIIRFDTHDIYHMDMPVKDLINIEPPIPIREYMVDKWYMRDANWSPDWPSSAKQIEWFYKKENSLLPPKDQINNFEGEFEGIIGITPGFVKSLIGLVGPVNIEGVEYNQDNFTELLEYRVERGYVELGVPKWNRKEVIGQIVKELKIRLLNLPLSRLNEIINIVETNINKKDILVYLKDQQIQRIAEDFGWAGEVKNTDGDYLMIIDANLAALKTDAVMNRSINYSVEKSASGLFAKLRVNYAHHGGFDWRTTRYRTYTRVYVPYGSQLVKIDGLTDDEVDIGQEFNKTYFGGFISIEPGKMRSLYLEYKLPENIYEIARLGKYELYLQKQPGKDVEALIVDLNLENDIKSYSPIGFSAKQENDRKIKWETDFQTDRVFSVNF